MIKIKEYSTQSELLKAIAQYKHFVCVLETKLAELDAPARKAYNDSLEDLPNWQIRAWEELTEERRNEWRAKV